MHETNKETHTAGAFDQPAPQTNKQTKKQTNTHAAGARLGEVQIKTVSNQSGQNNNKLWFCEGQQSIRPVASLSNASRHSLQRRRTLRLSCLTRRAGKFWLFSVWVCVWRSCRGRRVLTVSNHKLTCDGWRLSLFFERDVPRPPPPLPPPPCLRTRCLSLISQPHRWKLRKCGWSLQHFFSSPFFLPLKLSAPSC